jgi:ubiquinone/menaquinone biosynthesis C-methylase UbiE
MSLQQAAAGFPIFQSWGIYGAIYQQNYMRHREIVEAGRRVVARFDRPIDALDLGCGDGQLARESLKQIPVASYVGVDLSEGALAELRKSPPRGNADPPAEVVCDRRDLRDAIRSQAPSSFDVVLASYSLHHLDEPADKLSVLVEIARVLKPGGLFLWTDVARQGSETRTQYNTSLEKEIRDRWLEMPKGEVEQVVTHIHAADFPETATWMLDAASHAGLTRPVELFRDRFFGTWSFDRL